MNLPFPTPARQRNILALILIFIASIIVIWTLKLPGVFIVLLIVPAALLMLCSRPDASEQQALRASIALSSEDIEDVLAEYEEFQTSPTAEAIADRTLYRPALADADCDNPDIEQFHFQRANAQRFLNRLQARMAKPDLDISYLEQLLSITDSRALEFKESWLAARRAAAALGSTYNRELPAQEPGEESTDS
ncbi:MAG: hypothetical protein SOW59_06720 [Corynebacterium sp.]|nr:hypothetical protein [Corynebacterium sp.]